MDDLQLTDAPATVAPSPAVPGPGAENGRLAWSALNALPMAVCVIDQRGIVRAVNHAWEALAEAGSGRITFLTGDDCLASLDQIAAAGDAMAGEIAAGIRKVIGGALPEFVRKDVRCLSYPNSWFDVSLKALDDLGRRYFLLSLDDVSERRRSLELVVESEARHRHAERIARLGHWRLAHRDGDWENGDIEYSEVAAAILGLPPGGTTHSFQDMQRLIHPDDVTRVLAAYEQQNAHGYVVEYRIIRADGTIITLREAGESVSVEHGVTFEFGTIQDITLQRQDADRLLRLNYELEHLVAERTATLAERESQLSRAQALAGIGHYTWRKDRERRTDGGWHTGLTYAPAITAIFGVAPEDLVIPDEEYITRFVHPGDREAVNDAYFKQFSERITNQQPIEYRIQRPDGGVRYVVEIIERMVGDEGNVIEALGMIQDITTRKEAELALRASEARLLAFMENAPFIMSIKDTEGRMQMINREGAQSYRRSADELRGHLTQELIPGPSGRAITAMSREVIATGAAVTREIEIPGNQHYHWSLEIEFPIRGAEGEVTAIGGFAVDITEQKKAELALHESEARLRAIFDHVPVTLSLSNPAGFYTMVNRRFLEKVGRSEAEVIGHTAREVFGPEPARVLGERKAQVMRSLQSVTYEARTQTRIGPRDCVFTHFPITDDGVLTAVGTISLDMTEQRAAEAALHQAQKMELVGQLTGGLAHDFNNLLGAIIGNLDLLALDVDGRPRATELLQRAIAAAESGASLIQRLLAFSRRQTLSPRLIDINRQIQGMRPLLEHSLGGGLSITIRTAAEHPFSRVDPGQLEAALLNLVINARDAMPSGGKLIIETANVTMAMDAAEDPIPGPYIMIVVADEGTGMAPDVLARVFEPFFTTKPVGKGSGLGLSMVHGFVKQSGGHVHIDSQLGRGTTVGLFLPCADDADDDDAGGGAAVNHRPGHGEKILVIENDREILAFCVAALQQLGYHCVAAAGVPEAMRALAEQADIALVFSDILLAGGAKGPDLVQEARRTCPGLKALYTSGFSQAERALEAQLPAGDLFLAKPYRVSDLGQLVADILAESVP
jgi:PAS domain S-box-containing protein